MFGRNDDDRVTGLFYSSDVSDRLARIEVVAETNGALNVRGKENLVCAGKCARKALIEGVGVRPYQGADSDEASRSGL